MSIKSIDRPTLETESSNFDDLPFIAALPSATSYPTEGTEALKELEGAKIIRIGTTLPGLVEGGGLLIDYCLADGKTRRIIFGFTERGMWVERFQLFAS